MREWTFTLPSELPLQELESWWTLESSKNNYKGQKPLDWRVPYIIKKILECRCLKWFTWPIFTFQTQVMAKRRAGSQIALIWLLTLPKIPNWQFDSQPLKVGNRPDFLGCSWCVTYCWKTLDESYNFASNLISIWGFHTKLWAPKVAGVPTLGILGLSLGSFGTKWHLGVGPMAKHRIYYKGKSGGFHQVRVVVSFVSSWLLVARLCTKVL